MSLWDGKLLEGSSRRAVGILFTLLVLLSFDFFWAIKSLLQLDNTVHLPYYSELAWSFLHGKLYYLRPLPGVGDLSPFQGRLYAYWPPLTALLMMPLVALRGPDDFPQRVLAIFIGALNTGLFYLIAERLRQTLALRARRLPVFVAIIFGWGTSNLSFSVIANHWLIGQLTAMTFLLLGIWLAMDRDPRRRPMTTWLGGCALAVATLGRQNLILASPLWIFLALSDEHFQLYRKDVRAGWRKVLPILLPLILASLAMLLYNQARFGSYFENGLSYHDLDGRLVHDFQTYGYFNLRYVPGNVYYVLLRLPGFEHLDHRPGWMGFSLLIQCPFLFLLFGRKESRLTSFQAVLWFSVVLASFPIVALMSPGFAQFGARYLFDLMPFLTLLILLRQDRISRRAFVGLGALSVAINLFGPAFLLQKFHF